MKGNHSYTRHSAGKGLLCPLTGMKMIAIRLDTTDFSYIRRYATKRQISFAEAARQIISFGIETDRDS